MSTTEVHQPGRGPPGLALVMESDVDLRGMICTALLMEGHRVESVVDCAGVLAWCNGGHPAPDDFLLALGSGAVDPDWERLHATLEDDPTLSQSAVIVLLTIRNGLKFPARARIVQKPFAIDDLLALVASDIAAVSKRRLLS